APVRRTARSQRHWISLTASRRSARRTQATSRPRPRRRATPTRASSRRTASSTTPSPRPSTGSRASDEPPPSRTPRKALIMKKFRPLALVGIAAAASLILSSCAGDATPGASTGDDDGLTVAIVTPYLSNASTKEVIDLFTEDAESRGWTVSVEDTAGDMNRLNSAFQNAAAQQPDAIVLGMGDPTQVSLGLKAAADA